MSSMTQHDINTLAIDLGITREAWPEYWGDACEECYRYYGHDKDCRGEYVEFCDLPAPDSDDPRAVAWEPFLMRAMGWPTVYHIDSTGVWAASVLVYGAFYDSTPTAALYAAYKAKREVQP